MNKLIRPLLVCLSLLAASAAFAKDVVLESEVLKLVLHEQTGAFSLYRKTGEKGRLVPLNDIADDSSTTGFSIKIGSQIKRLSRTYGIDVSAVEEEDGSVSFVWEIKDTLSVKANFSLYTPYTYAEGAEDCVRVDISAMSLVENEMAVSFKAVMDTILGEKSRIHFTTARGTAISSEKAYQSMNIDKWISSSNGSETVSLLLSGAGVRQPELVLAAPRDVLLSDEWKPPVNEGRSFTSYQNFNNSAVGIWWAEQKINLFQSARYTFFITTAADGTYPPNAAILGKDGFQQESLSAEAAESASRIIDTVVQAQISDSVIDAPVKKSVDYDYARQLIERVEALDDKDKLDPDEISKLNDELDAIILELVK